MSGLRDRLAFLAATDALKELSRANHIFSGSRRETVAEHSWHVSLLAMLFADAAPDGTNHDRVRDLIVIHDLVEVYAGDTVLWDNVPDLDVAEREAQAAERLMAMLPEDQRPRFDPLWREFQAQATTESRFARALDALHPMLMSWGPGGAGHPLKEPRPRRILERKRPLLEEFPELWELARWLVASAVERGLIAPDEPHATG